MDSAEHDRLPAAPRRAASAGRSGTGRPRGPLRIHPTRPVAASGHQEARRFRQPGHPVTGNRQINSDGIGWEYVHLAIDDHSRVAFGCIEPDERGSSACGALLQAIRYYRELRVRFERVLTDNGACYKSRCFRRLVRRLGMRHLRTRPYTPRTNGKAERLMQTSLRE